MKNLAKNSLFNSIYNVANIVFPLITSMYVSRILMPEGIGRVSYASNFASYFLMLSALGLPVYGIREISKANDDRNKKDRLFSELFIIGAIATFIVTIIYLILIFSISSYRNDVLLYLTFGFQVFMNVFNIDWFYQGTEDYGYIAKRTIIIKLLSVLAVFIFVKNRNDYIVYAIITVLALSLNHLFNLYHAHSLVKLTFKNISLIKHIKPLIILGITFFLGSLYIRIDVTMLGIISSEYHTGIYTTAHKIIDIVITACASISAVFLPQLSYQYKNNKKEFYEIVSYGERILNFITTPIVVGLFILAPKVIVILFGKAFSASSLTIRIFLPIIFIRTFGDLLCYQLIIATNNEKKRIPAYIAATIANIVLNAILIPRLQENGAAVASVLSELLVNGIQFVVVFKLLEIKFEYRSAIEAIFSSAVMGTVVFFISKSISNLLLSAITSTLIGALTYFIVNVMIKNKTTNEIICFLKRK